jgi:hypothetical protein
VPAVAIIASVFRRRLLNRRRGDLGVQVNLPDLILILSLSLSLALLSSQRCALTLRQRDINKSFSWGSKLYTTEDSDIAH